MEDGRDRAGLIPDTSLPFTKIFAPASPKEEMVARHRKKHGHTTAGLIAVI